MMLSMSCVWDFRVSVVGLFEPDRPELGLTEADDKFDGRQVWLATVLVNSRFMFYSS